MLSNSKSPRYMNVKCAHDERNLETFSLFCVQMSANFWREPAKFCPFSSLVIYFANESTISHSFPLNFDYTFSIIVSLTCILKKLRLKSISTPTCSFSGMLSAWTNTSLSFHHSILYQLKIRFMTRLYSELFLHFQVWVPLPVHPASLIALNF